MVASLPCKKETGTVAAHMLCFKEAPRNKVPVSGHGDELLLHPTEVRALKYPCMHRPKTKKYSRVLRYLDRF